MQETAPEPWLSGPLPDLHPLIQPVFFSFIQVRQELAKHMAGVTREQLWRKIGGASAGFHIKHLAGSVDRLTTYLLGDELSEQQLRRLREEETDSENIQDLLRLVDETLTASERRLQSLDPSRIYEARAVGRKRLPTTVIGLLVHLSEHTQRHLGQAITTAKFLRDIG